MTTFLFLYPHTSFFHWLVYRLDVLNLIFSDIIGALVGILIIGGIIRPFFKRLHTWILHIVKAHLDNQTQLIATQQATLVRLDAHTAAMGANPKDQPDG
jgi:uncharacterized membrane protein YraQ (UPF0718 family)